MNDELSIRPAKLTDIDFLIKAIISAEKGNTDTISYCKIFILDEQKFREILATILTLNIDNFEFSLSSFLIIEINGNRIATCSSWIEGRDGLESKIIKGNSLLFHLDKCNFTSAKSKQDAIIETSIPRELGAIQIDSVYVDSNYRGRGLVGVLIKEHIENLLPDTNNKIAQILVRGNNSSAIKAYEKLGFKIKKKYTSNHPDTIKYLPCITNVLMENRDLNILLTRSL